MTANFGDPVYFLGLGPDEVVGQSSTSQAQVLVIIISGRFTCREVQLASDIPNNYIIPALTALSCCCKLGLGPYRMQSCHLCKSV